MNKNAAKSHKHRQPAAFDTVAQVERFLEALDPDARDWLFCTYEDFKGADKLEPEELTRIKRGNITDRDLRQLLKRKNGAGAGVYVKLNETPGNSLMAEDVTRVRAVMLDLDGEALEPVLQCPLRPHAIVETSPSRFHVYWRVTDDFPIEQFEPIQRGLAKRFDGDPGVAKLSVLARLPGFKHMKDGEGDHTVRLHTLKANRPAYSYEQIAEEFPPRKRPHKLPRSLAGSIVLSAATPVDSARQFLEQCFSKQDAITLHYHQGCFYAWLGTHYAEVDELEVRSDLYGFLDKALTLQTNGKPAPFNPAPHKVNQILDALKSGVLISRKHKPPCWLEPLEHMSAEGLIACRNGVLDIKTRQLLPHEPLFFNVNSLPFDYDPDAPSPKLWCSFLRDLWPGDKGKQARLCLQEMFGLMLTNDTRFHKIFLIIGPSRSGKGTIGRVLAALLGRDNVRNPTLASLTGEFGLWPLIDKRAAIITDARLGLRADAQVVAERLLSISGEDDLDINRKNLPHWHGKLGVRFLIMTNDPPRIADPSGALVSRLRAVEPDAVFPRQRGSTAN